jgi:hypothetical protein
MTQIPEVMELLKILHALLFTPTIETADLAAGGDGLGKPSATQNLARRMNQHSRNLLLTPPQLKRHKLQCPAP